jgi:peroxiredoxin
MSGASNDASAIGARAPNFALRSSPQDMFSSKNLRGNPAILAFYPADWSPVCGDQLALYQAVLPEFERYNAQLVGISVDGAWCHRAYAQARGLTFPLLADFEPKGEVSRRYDAYRVGDGFSERALFVLDANGVIAWREVVAPEVNPGADGILAALDRLTTTTKV